MENDWDAAGGIGFNGPVNDFVDIYGTLLFHHIKYESRHTSTGMEANIGSRIWFGDKLEAYGSFGRLKKHSVLKAGVRFHSSDQLSVNMGIKNNGIWGPQTELGVRFEY
jgi:hypothetical protein